MKSSQKVRLIIFVLINLLTASSINSPNFSNHVSSNENLFISLNSELYIAGDGENINITLHQSYVNSSTIDFANLSESNSFYVPCPAESSFNSSNSEISVNNIIAPNKTLIIQNNPFDSDSECSNPQFTSFKVDNDCYLVNGSINILYIDSPIGDIHLFNSSWNSITKRNEPNIDNPILLASIALSGSGGGWRNYDFTDLFLNSSKTDNNTWFIAVRRNSPADELNWRWTFDTPSNNNSYAYYFATTWIYQEIDFCITVGLSPISANPSPSEIGMKINDTLVNGTNGNSGYWFTSNNENFSPTGNLEFSISCNWWDVACSITNVKLNYTKTDIKAKSTFSIPEANLKLWNASINENIDGFDSRISDFNYISFIIPANWSYIKIFNGSIEKSVNISTTLLNNYKKATTFDAGNGTNWFLTAIEDNRIIDSSGGGGGGGGGDDDKEGESIPGYHFTILVSFIALIPLILIIRIKTKSQT